MDWDGLRWDDVILEKGRILVSDDRGEGMGYWMRMSRDDRMRWQREGDVIA